KLFEAGAQVSRLEAEIRHVVDSRERLQARRNQLQQQMQEWSDQQQHCIAQIAQIEEEQEIARGRTEEAREQGEAARAALPDIEQKVRSAASSREEMRVALARVEQNLALAAQAQRDADRQIQLLEQRQERLEPELRDLDEPDAAELERLAGEREMLSQQLEEAQAQLAEVEERVPGLDEQRLQAQAQAQEAQQAVARLDARLAALAKLQEDVQKQGALEPWLEKHELQSLGRLWQKLKIETGWETALESILRERMAALELRQLDHARAFASDAPPARLAFYQTPAAAPADQGE